MSDDDLGRAVQAPSTSSRSRRPTLVALGTVLAGPLAWLVQLWVLAMIGDIPCRGGGDVLRLPVEAWWIIVSLGTAMVAGASLLVAQRVRSAPHDRDIGRASDDGVEDGGSPWDMDDDERDPAIVRRLALLGLWSSALALVTILLGATAPFFLHCPSS